MPIVDFKRENLYLYITMGIRRVILHLKRTHELLFKKGDSMDFTIVKRGENIRIDGVLEKILGIPPYKEVRLYEQQDVNALIDYVGEYEHREIGDTCKMILKFNFFVGEPLKYYAWEGIVPRDDCNSYMLGISRIRPEERFGIVTGRGILKMVLIEKYRE